MYNGATVSLFPKVGGPRFADNTIYKKVPWIILPWGPQMSSYATGNISINVFSGIVT